MAKKIIWSQTAHNDRKGILAYWKKRNKSDAYSIKLFALFKDSAATISIYPEFGIATQKKNIRFTIVKDYLIFYAIETDYIKILRIWDSRQNPVSLKL